MKLRINKTRLTDLYQVMGKQVLLFFLLFNFINTMVFPTVMSVSRASVFKSQLTSALENPSSLTEFILEECLQVDDATPDEQERDISDLEKLYDEEIDLLDALETGIAFQQWYNETQHYLGLKYPLTFPCSHSSTPPPES
jgi:hypothetical protein